jgi:hypothetical protein
MLAGLLLPTAALAGDFDLDFAVLGSPASLADFDGKVVVQGNPQAQERFERLVGELGLALTPVGGGPAWTSGVGGLEVALSTDVAVLHARQAFSDGQARAVWPAHRSSSGPRTALAVPALHVRKGLPFGFEVGSSLGVAAGTSYGVAGAHVKWALLEGLHLVPDVAVQLFGNTGVGTGPLTLVTAGWEAGAAERWALTENVEAALYGGLQRIGLAAATGSIDFAPTREVASQPTVDDGVFSPLAFGSLVKPATSFDRWYAGARLRRGSFSVGLEASRATVSEGSASAVRNLEVWRGGFSVGVTL